jgi:hypothetical protein
VRLQPFTRGTTVEDERRALASARSQREVARPGGGLPFGLRNIGCAKAVLETSPKSRTEAELKLFVHGISSTNCTYHDLCAVNCKIRDRASSASLSEAQYEQRALACDGAKEGGGDPWQVSLRIISLRRSTG